MQGLSPGIGLKVGQNRPVHLLAHRRAVREGEDVVGTGERDADDVEPSGEGVISRIKLPSCSVKITFASTEPVSRIVMDFEFCT